MFGRVFKSNFRNISPEKRILGLLWSIIAKSLKIKGSVITQTLCHLMNVLRTLRRRKMGRIGKAKVLQLLSRVWSGPNGVLAGKQAEQKMTDILRNKFPKAQVIEVTDVSGGCGAMFHVNVIAPEFEGLNTVKQHRLINDTLKDEIKDMHGIRIETGIPRP